MNLAYIQITRLCNQRCKICSNPEMDATLGVAKIEEHLDFLQAQGYAGVFLTGGEPTLHPHLPRLIRSCRDRSLHVRIITNGQKIADRGYLQELIDAGLEHLHLSLMSSRAETQGYLSGNPDSLAKISQALGHLAQSGPIVDINTAINHYNADHLDEIVDWVLDRAPRIGHFVWDHLDPSMNRASENPDAIPRLWESELSLKRAMDRLAKSHRTFRVERLPLCFMADYAHSATEARKIVKNEDRLICFLDEKGVHREVAWRYGKATCCQVCTFDPICPGLWEMDRHYLSDELHPVFLPAEPVIRKIQGRSFTTPRQGD